MTGLPVLSVMTWAPFVAALVVMFFARRSPLLVRWTSLHRRHRVAGRVALGLLVAYDRAAAGFQFQEQFAAGALARASRIYSPSTA